MNAVHVWEAGMSQKIDNAKETLMEQCRLFLLQNHDGRCGRFNVRDLTARCGMASGTFYHYFKSKDELVLLVMERDWSAIIDEIEPIAGQNCSLRDKVKAIYEKINGFERRYYFSAMRLLSQTPENLARRQENERRMYDLIQNFLRAETERGELAFSGDYEIAAYLLIQLFLAAGRNPGMDFDKLWECMNFIDTSAAGQKFPGRV